MLYNNVRDAFVISVAYDLPFVRFHNNQVSTVPKQREFFSKSDFVSGNSLINHSNFVAEKYGSES